MTVHFHEEDLPADLFAPGAALAVDTETMGLITPRDRLCIVQVSDGGGTEHLVRFGPRSTYDAPNLKAVLADPARVKLYHFARFDLAAIRHYSRRHRRPGLLHQDRVAAGAHLYRPARAQGPRQGAAGPGPFQGAAVVGLGRAGYKRRAARIRSLRRALPACDADGTGQEAGAGGGGCRSPRPVSTSCPGAPSSTSPAGPRRTSSRMSEGMPFARCRPAPPTRPPIGSILWEAGWGCGPAPFSQQRLSCLRSPGASSRNAAPGRIRAAGTTGSCTWRCSCCPRGSACSPPSSSSRPLFTGGDVSFLLDKNRVEVSPERLRIESAEYRGEDAKGRAFRLRAGSAVQKSSAEPIVRLNALSAEIQMPEGPATLKANDGRYDMEKEQVAVDGADPLRGRRRLYARHARRDGGPQDAADGKRRRGLGDHGDGPVQRRQALRRPRDAHRQARRQCPLANIPAAGE